MSVPAAGRTASCARGRNRNGRLICPALRRMLPLDVLAALRDAEKDLGPCHRNPDRANGDGQVNVSHVPAFVSPPLLSVGEIIPHAIWLDLRFTLSYRDVEELLAERGFDVSYETVRRWVLKFGPLIARKLRQGRPRPSARWHLDEMVVRIAGKRMYLWRAVDHEGEVLDMLVQRRRDT